MKSSQQAQLIHANLAAEVAHLKQQHSKELAITERRRAELVQALEAQVDEVSQALEATKLEQDLTMTNLRATHDG